MELFKYLKKGHFDALMCSGLIRVGTLRGYQSIEHGSMVSDSMEGAKRFTGKYTNLTADKAKESQALSSVIHIGEGGGVGTLEFTNIVIIERNYFIFSMSSIYSEADHKSWLNHESYNACYRIVDLNNFFRRVTNILNKKRPVRFLGLHEVHYYNEKQGMDFFDPKNSFPAFALKDFDGFSEQKEVRAVWVPISEEDIHPIVLHDTRLRAYVRLHRKI